MQNSPDMQNGSGMGNDSSMQNDVSGANGTSGANSAAGANGTGMNTQINPEMGTQTNSHMNAQMNQQVQNNQQMQGRPGMQGSPIMQTGQGMQGGQRMQGNPGMQGNPSFHGAQGTPYNNRNMQATPYMQANRNSQVFSEKQNIYGGFFVRFSAYLVDFIIVQFVLCLIRIPLLIAGTSSGMLTNDLLFQYSLTEIILYLAYKAYFVICTYSSGTTLGKRLFRLKVVQNDGEKLTLWNVLYRETIGKYLSAVIINIGYIIIGLTPEKTAFHDYLCDTRVIYTTES